MRIVKCWRHNISQRGKHKKVKSIVSTMKIESEIKDIKMHLTEISKKINGLMHEREVAAMMSLSEKSLSQFFEEEPEIYQLKDLKVRYK